MTKREVFSISLKILGVISVMYAIRSIPSIGMAIGMAFQGSIPNYHPYLSLGLTIAFLAFNIIIAYILLRWGDLIAESLVRDDSVIPALITKEWEMPIFILSLRIIGVVCVIKGIPGLVKILANFWFRGMYPGKVPLPTVENITSAIVLLIFGGYLISGGSHFVKFVFRGLNTTPSSNDIA